MNVATRQQLMDNVIRAIERDSNTNQTATENQLRQASKRLAGEVRKVENAFQRAAQADKMAR